MLVGRWLQGHGSRAALHGAYPTARIVVVEIEDWDLDVDLPGPVKRLLAADADGYVTADSVEDLARQLAPSVDDARIDDTRERVALPSADVDDAILAALNEQRSERERVDRRRNEGS